MFFIVIGGGRSLREVSCIMLAFKGKINHLGLKDFSSAVNWLMLTGEEAQKYMQPFTIAL